ncbi:MAG: restriction endonuclease subunit S [Acidobacteriota bacterium]|nr:restriction endonuclease subunit S [Acidobacteriota bacterium]
MAMKKGWKTETLGELCEFRRGLTYAKGDEVETSRNVVLRATNINLLTNLLDLMELKYISDKVVIPLEKKVKKDSLIICTASGSKSHLGKVAYIDDDYGYAFGGFMGMITPKGNLLPKFLFHLMTSDAYKDFVGELSDGANINNLKYDQLRQFQIPFPPLPEQRRIVGILDKAFESIANAKANAEKNLQNAQVLFESYLQSVFAKRGEGWEVREISEVAKHSLGKMLDKAKNKGKPQPYLRNINVRWFSFDLSNLLQMPFLPEESAKYTAINGDVLICEGGYPGRAAIWSEDYPIYFQKALHRVRFHESIYNKWFVYFLYAQDKSGVLKQHFSGTGIQHFTGEVLARLEIPLPPLPELRCAISRFNELSTETQRLSSLYQRKLAALDELKKSLLQQAFSGQL